MKFYTFYSLFPACLYVAYALECGINVGSGQNELKKLAGSCMNVLLITDTDDKNATDASTRNNTDQSSEEEVNFPSNRYRRSSTNDTKHTNQTNRRNDTNNTNRRNDTNNTNRRNDTNDTNDSNHTNDTRTENNQTESSITPVADDISQKCVVQCIFEKFNMTDANGFPNHAKVSEGLLKSAKGRELRDFLQDTTDVCFQTISQADKSDACQFSSRLITCLAEKGKVNCADWPVGELPFQMDNQNENTTDNRYN